VSLGDPPQLFPYRPRPGQELILREVATLTRTGGALIVEAATGSGKTVAALAPLLEHAIRADHKVLYLVRTHSQQQQVLTEARAIAHRAGEPFLAVGLAGRQKRCTLLESTADFGSATAEESGKLCADRKRVTQAALEAGQLLEPPAELPAGGPVDLADLDGCPYYAKVLQADLDALVERFAERLPSPPEYEEYCRTESLCAYELSKKLLPKARLVLAPYAFFFHPHVRQSLFSWMGVGPDRLDLVLDEAHNLPDYLRELSSVVLPREALKRARGEIAERGDFAFPDGLHATELFDRAGSALDELVKEFAPEDDGVLPPNALEDALLGAVGGTSHRLDTYLGSLVSWGESLREERRKARQIPRSAVHAVALTLLSWPRLEPPQYVKVVTREPRPALEAYSVDARGPAEPVGECHLSVHLSGTLRPLEGYRDALGLPETSRSLVLPSPFPLENRRLYFDPGISTRFEEIQADPEAVPRLARRVAEVLRELPVRTAVFFPSFALMEQVLAAGLREELPREAVIESRGTPMADLWRALEGFRRGAENGVLLGVTGGRIAEGVDFPDDELEAVVLVGLPFPKPTARREALRTYLDLTTGHGWEYCVLAPTQHAMLQALGRLIRSETDRGIGILLDHRAAQFASALPGLEPLGDLSEIVREFYGRPSGPAAASRAA
jgi:DNA excision repair protein ERCC-2